MQRLSVRQILAAAAAPLAWVTLFSCFLNVSYLAAPLYMMQVYDRVLRSQSVPTLLYLTLIVAVAYAAIAILDGVRGFILASISDIVEQFLSVQLLQCATAPIEQDRNRPAATHIGRDLDIVRQFASGSAILAFVDLPWAPIYLLVLFMLHWELGIFATCICLLLLALSVAGERVTNGPMTDAGQSAGRAYVFGDAITRHADCASTMGLAAGLPEKWRNLRTDMLTAQNLATSYAVLLNSATKFVRMFTQSAILGFGAYLAIHHEVSGGAVFAGSLLLGRCLGPVEGIIASWRGTLAAKGALGRIQTVVSFAHNDVLALPPPRGEIVLEDVTWTPADSPRPALANLTMRIEPGAVLAVVGPNAAGKSTLGRVLAGAIRPGHGRVRLDGAELASWEPTQLGQAIGYLPQNYCLFPGTIRENIARFGNVTDADVVTAARAAMAHDMILHLPSGYQTQVEEGSGSLSGGQRQRVALARALLFDPSVLVLDEPNASLDADGEAALFRCIAAARERCRTIVVITHSPALVRLADFVATMVDGRILRMQPSREFLGRPLAAAVGE